MRLKIQFKRYRETTPPGFDGKQVRFPFKVIIYQDPPFRDEESEHRIEVTISDSLIVTWGWVSYPNLDSHPALIKTLFAYAELHIKSVISTGNLPGDFGNIDLHTANVPQRNPIDPNKVSWPEAYELELSPSKPASPAQHMVELESSMLSVFISYSYDSDDHIEWIYELASRLATEGVKVIIDKNNSLAGNELTHFMERSVSESNFVLIICTPEYKKKADNRTGGVGYEARIITNEILTQFNDRKFIPILREGEWNESLPIFLSSNHAVDMRGTPFSTENYHWLLKSLGV